jgi:catechol 2,3-dioxygenase-like lactoylglutathione lyase family enzyme
VTATRLIPSLGVSDIDRSRDFYRRFFGLEVVDSYEDEGRMAWCWLRAGGAELMLQQLTADQQIRLNPAIGQSWVVYLRVDDLEGVHRQLTQGGFPASDIAQTQYGAREFFVPDPDGYEIWVCSPDDGSLEVAQHREG